MVNPGTCCPGVQQWIQPDVTLKSFTIIGYMFVLFNEGRHTLGLDLLQCLFHMLYILPRMITVMEMCNAIITVVVLESQVIRNVAVAAKVPLEKPPSKAGIRPGDHNPATLTLTL